LIRAGEGDGYLRPPERSRDRWLNGHHFATGSLLLPSAGQSAEEDVDGLLRLLEVIVVEDHVWFEDRWMVASWCDE
jgi:hypothetical protein